MCWCVYFELKIFDSFSGSYNRTGESVFSSPVDRLTRFLGIDTLLQISGSFFSTASFVPNTRKAESIHLNIFATWAQAPLYQSVSGSVLCSL